MLDRATGLLWQRERQASKNFVAATNACHEACTGGRFGWRLPTVAELISLFESSGTSLPSFPAGHPFAGPTTGDLLLWTSSPYPDNSLHYVVQNSINGATNTPYLFASAGFGSGSSAAFLWMRSAAAANQ